MELENGLAITVIDNFIDHMIGKIYMTLWCRRGLLVL